MVNTHGRPAPSVPKELHKLNTNIPLSQTWPKRVMLFPALIATGLLGNFLHFPIFLNIDFLFGSVFAMLTLQFFGLSRGIVAAALIASYTYVLWNEPYATVILTAEVAVVGSLMARRKMGMVLADMLYWIFLGLPLAYIFYELVLDVAPASTHIIMTKQAVNGIANALVARLIFTGLALSSGSAQTSFRELIYNLLAAFVLFPALLMLAVSSRADFTRTDQNIRTLLQQDYQSATRYLDDWVQDRTRALVTLTGIAATLTPQQMQGRLEQALASDNNFLRIGMRDTESVITAYAPPLDESGQSNIGKRFAERPYIAELKRTLKPMLAEVVVARIDRKEPVAILLAPFLRQGQYAGYVNSVLRLDQIRRHLETVVQGDALLYSLIDTKGNVILSNRTDQKMMTPFVRGNGTLAPVDPMISQWVPALAAGASVSERWQNSFYVAQSGIGERSQWKLVLEQPVAPFQKAIYDNYSGKLMMLFLILLVALALAEFLSRQTLATIDTLSTMTHALPLKLTTGDRELAWPQSGVQETTRLINNFSEMAASLTAQFDVAQQVNQSLEQQVQMRTAALQQNEVRFRTLVEWTPEPIGVHRAGKLIYVNPAAVQMFGANSALDLIGKPILELVHPEFHEVVLARVRKQTEEGVALAAMQEKFLKLDGTPIDVEVQSTPIIYAGEPAIQVAMRNITERKAAEAQIQALAFSDSLTGLPNRRLLLDRLEQAMVGSVRHGHQNALLFVDMDDFKTLNDSLGHDKGDQLLQQIAQRMLTCVREGDTVARLGGDEFVVLLEDLDKSSQEAAQQAEAVGRKIHNALHQPYQLGSHGYHSSASIGITLFGGAQRERIEEPLKRGELAMYKAKTEGRDNLRFFEPEMRTAVAARAALETDLREALTKCQFLLFYQPQVGRDDHLTGVEALVRWQHPERGLISPAEFIPVAEANGLILPLGQWVLETACRQIAAWALQPEMARLTISINVSARQFSQPNFVEDVLAILHTTGANPERLMLELTESLLLDNMKDIITKMNALKARGVGFSLDDFGTGYSSLSYLKRLPLDDLKIDQGFVKDLLSDPNDAAIAKMVVALADSMGLGVVAEGVETEAQRDALSALGCNAYQGYLFSRPLPIDQFEAFARGA